MSVATVLAALTAQVAAVPDVGRVHDAEPFGRTQQQFLDLYGWDDGAAGRKVRGWWIRRVRTAEQDLAIGRTVDVHTFLMRGFAVLEADGIDSGKAFDALIEAIRRANRADRHLGGVATPGPLDKAAGWQLTDSVPVMLAGVLCHSATLQIQLYEYLDNGE